MYATTNLEKFATLADLVPEAFRAFAAFDKAAVAPGALSVKHKELIAVGVALTTQCPYCIDLHVRKAREAGASEKELAETVMVAAALRAGGAVAHGTHCVK